MSDMLLTTRPFYQLTWEVLDFLGFLGLVSLAGGMVLGEVSGLFCSGDLVSWEAFPVSKVPFFDCLFGSPSSMISPGFPRSKRTIETGRSIVG